MKETNDFNDISNEVLTVLSYWDKNLIMKIPNSLITELAINSADSSKKCHIDPNKKLEEQDILEESKDLIALMYYSFIADEYEKAEIRKKWNINEEQYLKELYNKYNPENIFKDKEKTDNEATTESTELIEYKEDNPFIKFIKKILHFLGIY